MGTHGNHLEARPLQAKRAVALALISIFILCATLIGTLAMAISAPQSVREGEQLTVTLSGTGSLSITRDSSIIATGTGTVSSTLQTGSASAGLIAYTFTDGTGSESRTVEVIDVPLAVTPTSPASSDIATSNVLFALDTNWQPEFCYINIDGTSHTLDATGPASFAGSFTVPDGVHTIEYKCKLGSELAQAMRSIHVDTAAPVVTAASPGGEVIGPYVTLSVDTDEISICRFGTENVAFEALPQEMGASYVLRNTATVHVPAHGSYTYFVRCKDVSGNTMQSSHIISFLNKVPPSATITLDEEEPLKAGTYRVTVRTDLPLSATPLLSYAFQESGKRQQVALTGEQDTWTGQITIEPDVDDTVLAFSFVGKSIQGVEGTLITEGTMFTVDVKAPPGIDSIRAENDTGRIALTWYAVDDKDHASYNIYRSATEGVDHTDFYALTSHTEYTDADVLGSRYYYYRVAPVDEAGNVGPLSYEVWGSAIDGIAAAAVPAGDPLALARIDDELASLDAALLDAKAAVKALEEEPNPVTSTIISDMQLIESGKAGILKLEAAATSLKGLKARSPSTDETDAAIAQSRKEAEEARKLLVKRIVAQEETQTTQQSDDAAVKRYAPYALVGIDLGKGKEGFIADAGRLQDRATVAMRASTFTVYTLAGEAIDYTFVSKRITLQDPANDIVIIEAIPAGVAADVADVTFSKTPIVLSKEAVVQYAHPVLQQEEYSYYIKRIVSLEDVKASRTLLYPKPSALAPEPVRGSEGASTGNALTGNAIALIPSSGDGVLIGIGVIIIIALGAYYVSLEQKPHIKRMPVVAAPGPIVRKPLPQRTTRTPASPVPIQRASTPAQPPEPASPPSDTDRVKQALADAEALIDTKRYDEALVAYKQTMSSLQADRGLEQMLHEETVRLYAKLLLFKQLAAAKAAADAADPERLRALLDGVRRLAAQVGEDNTLLITEAKASYADFVRKLNALEIERAGKY